METKVPKKHCIISWNVDGYSEDVHNWLLRFTKTNEPDVIFISETKRNYNYLVAKFSEFIEYNVCINVHVPDMWHGVAMLIKKQHEYLQLTVNMNIPVRSDNKTDEAATGRVIAICLNNSFFIIGCYTPNSGLPKPSKFEYRVQTWDPAFQKLLEVFRDHGPTMWIGDVNVALDDIDVSDPDNMTKWSGFTPEERSNFKDLLDTGEWIDIWRQQNPSKRQYTWCGNPRKKNYGLRIDNILVTKSLLPYTANSFIIAECPASADHLPIGAYIYI